MHIEPSLAPIAVTERRTVGPSASPLAAAVPATTQRSDYLVLSAAAYTALSHAPSLDPEVAGTFSLTLLSANGELAVTPGAIPGTVHVSLELEQVRGWPPAPGPLKRLHFEAVLRSSWVSRAAASGPATPPQNVGQAIAELAQVPGQSTVRVDYERDGDANGSAAA